MSEPKDQKLQSVEATSIKRQAQPEHPTGDNAFELMEISWQGPIPPPAVLKQINDVVPNGAERVFAQFESETKHRHLMQRRAQSFPFFIDVLARVCALIFAFGCLALVAYEIEKGAYLPATVMGGAMIVAGINAFLRQSDARRVQKPEIPKQHPKKR